MLDPPLPNPPLEDDAEKNSVRPSRPGVNVRTERALPAPLAPRPPRLPPPSVAVPTTIRVRRLRPAQSIVGAVGLLIASLALRCSAARRCVASGELSADSALAA